MQGGEHHLCVQWVQYRKGAQMSGSPHPLLATGRRPTCFFSTERCTQAVTFGKIPQSKEARLSVREASPCGNIRVLGEVVSQVFLEPSWRGGQSALGTGPIVIASAASRCSLLFIRNPLPCFKRLLWKIHLLLPILGLESISCVCRVAGPRSLLGRKWSLQSGAVWIAADVKSKQP